MRRTRTRKSNGSSIAEMPVALWVFVFFMLFPFIDFVTVGCRLCVGYYGLRDAVTKAAFEQSFTNAVTKANGALATNAAAWNGISYSVNNFEVVQVDQAGTQSIGAPNTPWALPIVSQDVYLIRGTTQLSVQPLINLQPTGVWNACPGLTGPLVLQLTYQVTDENPQGLIN